MKALVQVKGILKGILKRMPVQRKASRTTCKQVGSFVRCARRIDLLAKQVGNYFVISFKRFLRYTFLQLASF